MLFRQQALASENSANITPKQTEKVEASAEIAESSASTKNCPSTSAGVPSQCDDTHSNHDSSDDNQSSDGPQSTQDTCLVPDQRLFMSSKYERRYNWLYYSAAKGGYCCKICELFAQESDNIFIKGTILGDHPTRKLERHLKNEPHLRSETKYITANTSSTPRVLQLFQQNAAKATSSQTVETNRTYMASLVKLCYFTVTQHWSLNQFEPLLDFLIDLKAPSLTAYMESKTNPIKYASSATVSDILTSIDHILEEEVLMKVRSAPFYSLLADESSDEAHKEQFAVLIRCPSGINKVKDHFLGIIHVERTDAASLMEAIETFLHRKQLDIKKAYFVGFDGCNTMSGENTGLQRRFRHHMPFQLYINCRNHKLALCVKHMMGHFPVLQNIDSLLLSVWKLFHYSPQKYQIFMDVQEAYGLKIWK